jgi:hypothetical protein
MYNFYIFFLQDSNDLVQSDPSNTERIGEFDTNIQTSEAGSDASALSKLLLFFFITIKIFYGNFDLYALFS